MPFENEPTRALQDEVCPWSCEREHIVLARPKEAAQQHVGRVLRGLAVREECRGHGRAVREHRERGEGSLLLLLRARPLESVAGFGHSLASKVVAAGWLARPSV